MNPKTGAGTIACLGLLAMLAAHAARARDAMIDFDPKSPPMMFAVEEIEAALKALKYEVKRRGDRSPREMPFEGGLWVRFAPANVPEGKETPWMKAEGFSIMVTRDGPHRLITVFSDDAPGAMYGGLELAEQIRANGVNGVVELDRVPYMPMRGTKFNAPLDLRTPSYSDMSDSAQKNIATMWDFEFWRAYLDQLARDRYNFVTLWNLHPFPSMVKVPEYPDVALDDVWRTTAPFAEDYSTRTIDLVTPAMLAQHEVIRRLTIAEKMDFWRRVMAYAKDRNIGFYVVTWNVYTYGVDGKYGIADALDNPKTVDYFRASVREMFRAYPLLAGIGLTAGENMGEVKMYSGGVDAFDAKENWLMATYGQGVLDAARAEPGRRFRLIHRQHESRAQDIAATFAPVIAQPNVEFNFSFKYAQAHALSSTTQTFHRGYVESLGELKTLWTIRNDDALLLRWAAPDFVREFVKNIPHEKSQGYYVGSDMWVWGREFLGRGKPRLEIEKHWLHFLLWGRLGYDPTLDDERIAALVARRYPGVDGKKMLAAWQDASMIYPLVTGFHWADFDFQWYIEGSRSRPGPARTESGFHSVDTFITQPVHRGTDNIPIPKYIEARIRGETPQGTTPLMVADRIDARADAVRKALPKLTMSSNPSSVLEFIETKADLESMALLGKYYAAKIRGATELEWFRATGDESHRRLAVKHLEVSADLANQYAKRVSTSYGPRFWTNRVGIVDFDELGREARHDVDIAQAAKPRTP
jgi:hypothetical protein